MRSLTLALVLGSAVILQACAGAPEKKAPESQKIINSILDPRLFEEVSCPKKTVRYCAGPARQLECTCVTGDSMRTALGRN
jgi:hypothetical protein